MMESPDEASEMESPMVVQGVVGDKQLFVSFPDAPFTYHVVVAQAALGWLGKVKLLRVSKRSEDLDRGSMAGSCGNPLVPRDQGCLQYFGERHVGCIVGAEIVA